MTVREELEKRERTYLSHLAVCSADTRGRERPMAPCPLRTEFQRDRDRILHCKSFRRLKFKTQVFISPEGDHYRTRLTHTLEVSQVARTIARALNLNEDLTEAIALGHDLGHTPFGHSGERTLNRITSTGYFPTAVSPVTITEDAPSRTALKISLTSARVGTGFCSMELSICVTTINDFSAAIQQAAIFFCAAGSFQRGMAFPRSPRAITISSASATNSDRQANPF